MDLSGRLPVSRSRTRAALTIALSALSPLAKQYVLRLLYAPEAVPQATMLSWLATGARPLHEAALRMLLTLRYFPRRGEAAPNEAVCAFHLARSATSA